MERGRERWKGVERGRERWSEVERGSQRWREVERDTKVFHASILQSIPKSIRLVE